MQYCEGTFPSLSKTIAQWNIVVGKTECCNLNTCTHVHAYTHKAGALWHRNNLLKRNGAHVALLNWGATEVTVLRLSKRKYKQHSLHVKVIVFPQCASIRYEFIKYTNNAWFARPQKGPKCKWKVMRIQVVTRGVLDMSRISPAGTLGSVFLCKENMANKGMANDKQASSAYVSDHIVRNWLH